MSFNLMTSPWVEVIREQGQTAFISPAQITEDFETNPITELNFPRADWNGAVSEFLIGLLSVALPPENEKTWAQSFAAPPSPEEFAAAFKKWVPYFDFDGEGSRAFQDLAPLDEQELAPIASLLIDAPGENTAKNNADLFVKRDGIQALCLPYAAAALITMQTYSPAGGTGYRTSLRGGGPLTTLVTPKRKGKLFLTLWDVLWANVSDADDQEGAYTPKDIFPWLSKTKTSENKQTVAQRDNPLSLAFFACPRRIRLAFTPDPSCSFSGETGTVVSSYREKNLGPSYQNWRHPLSPYRADSKEGFLPIHPQAGASNFGDWLAWWGLKGQPAQCQKNWDKRKDTIKNLLENTMDTSAFGFDMDNMKARQWLQCNIPWIPHSSEKGEEFRQSVEQLINATNEAARALQFKLKLALYGLRKKDEDGGGYRLPDNLSKDAMESSSDQLWADCEEEFRKTLRDLLSRLDDTWAPTIDIMEGWRNKLRRSAFQIFDDTVDTNSLVVGNIRRLTETRASLALPFSRHPKASVTLALHLSTEPKKPKNKQKEASA